MTKADISRNPNSRTLRQFATTWLLFFLAIGLLQYFKHGHRQLGIALCVAALVIGSLGLVRPGAVRWIFVGWMTLAFPIGWVISQLSLFVMFYAVLTPVALIMRLRGRDVLHLRRPSNASSYWLPKKTPEDIRRYLRQY